MESDMKSGHMGANGVSFLQFMPVSLFGAVMGLSALCFAWRLADGLWHVGGMVGEVIGWTALVVFVLVAVSYTVKWVRYQALVVREFNDPVSVGFFSTVIIS